MMISKPCTVRFAYSLTFRALVLFCSIFSAEWVKGADQRGKLHVLYSLFHNVNGQLF